MTKSAATALLAALFGCGGGSRPAPVEVPPDPDEQAAPEPVRLTLLSDVNRVAPGQQFTIAAQLDIEPGWHIYWRNPGDSGVATEVGFRGPDDFEIGEPRLPGPRRFERDGAAVAFGYGDRVLVSAVVTAPDTLNGEVFQFQAEAAWLACQEECEKGAGTQSVEVVKASANMPSEPQNQAVFADHQARLPRPLSSLANARHDWRSARGGHELVIYVDGGQKVEFFPEREVQATMVGQAMVPGQGVGALHITFQDPGPETVRGVLHANDGQSDFYFDVDLPGPATGAEDGDGDEGETAAEEPEGDD